MGSVRYSATVSCCRCGALLVNSQFFDDPFSGFRAATQRAIQNGAVRVGAYDYACKPVPGADCTDRRAYDAAWEAARS